ncbi:MAG: carboxymuconolactone decarboxylase family protein [Sterolibacterium sp.]
MLDEKTAKLVAIGASIAAGCQPCLNFHVAKAREIGLPEEDILAAVDVGKQVRKGAAGKMDTFAAGLLGNENTPVASGNSGCTPGSGCC